MEITKQVKNHFGFKDIDFFFRFNEYPKTIAK